MNLFVRELNALLYWLTPEHMKEHVQDYKNVRMYLISHLFGPFVAIPFMVYLLLNDPNPYPDVWILAGIFLSFWVCPFALKLFQKSYFVLSLLSVQNFLFAILWGALNYGGAGSPFLMWVLMMPLFAFFYLGASLRTQVIIFAQLTVSLLLFYGANQVSIFKPDHIPQEELLEFSMLSTLVAAIFIYLMANYYARIVDSQSELIKEVDRHKVTLEKLTDAKDDAERASSAKSDFLANMSHELRTPLNAVLGYSEILLEDAELDGRGEEIADLQKISAAGKHLLAMVNDILDISKIEAGKADLYLETFCLDKFVGEVEATARPLAAKNSNAFEMKKGENLGDVHLDSTKLRQSVLNLLSNAGKFTQDGLITLSVERVVQDEKDWIHIAVRDTGVGISEENQKNLFHNFSQANSSITAKFGGTGLGLSLSQNLCRLMGGNILLESEFGKGSCVTIQLPASAVVNSDEESTSVPVSIDLTLENDGEEVIDNASKSIDRYAVSVDDEEQIAQLDEGINALRQVHKSAKQRNRSNSKSVDTGKRKTVLVIDDDRNFLDVAERVLEREGCQSILTDSPASALQLALTIKPDVILLDVVMPGLDGWDVLVTLKSEPASAHIPVIMISNVADREKARRFQAAGFIEKPLDGDKLRTALNSLSNSPSLLTG